MGNPRDGWGMRRGRRTWRHDRTRAGSSWFGARRGSGAHWFPLAAIVVMCLASLAPAQLPVQDLPPSPTEPITIAAETIRNWTHGDVRVLLLRGNVYVSQGLKRLRAPNAVVWIYETATERDGTKRLEVYAEGGVRVDGPRRQITSTEVLEVFQTRADLKIEMRERLTGPAVDDPVYRRGEARRVGVTQPAVQLTAFQPEPPPTASDGTPLRRIRMSTRTMLPYNFDTVPVSPTEKAVVGTGGINLIVYNVKNVGTVDISADRVVIWLPSEKTGDLARGGETTQGPDEPLEMYLEGNVVVRQNGRTIECRKMYYDVARSRAVANDAEIETVSEEIGAPVYLRAKKLRQVAENSYVAQGVQVTPSVFASPGIATEAEEIRLVGTPVATTDPETGQPGQTNRFKISSTNNFFYIEGFPVFFLPYVEKELDSASTPLRKFAIGQSSVYGFRVETTFDAYQLFGLNQPPEVTKWDLDLDFMSERGPGAGTQLDYRGDELFGIDGRYWGVVDTWWLYDRGEDRIGDGRMDIEPEQEARGRFLFRHRHMLPDDFSLNVEFAWITDVNFLEQFFEKEWEEDKDQETLVYLKQQRENWAWSVLARGRILDFVTTTNYMPQLDFYWLGEPLLGDWLTYYTHSSLGYLELLDADRSVGDVYTNPVGTEGPTFVSTRADTSHEIDLPFSWGPVRIVPYLLGRATYWGEAIDHDSEGRLYGAAGARASIPFWRVFPTVESDLWNVHGLAHKIVFSVDYSLAQADLDHELVPQYDELEDDSEQVFRRRFLFRDYGVLPGTPGPVGIDERLYAIRRGLMTAPESVDDLHVLRFDARHRLQTKRGTPGQRHVIDWMTLDTAFAWFPASDRDNFSEDFGLITYDYSWHIGDRTSFLTQGWFETYDDGPMMWNAGVFLERPPRGSFYVGYSIIDPIDSRVVQTSYNYWMSPKWVSSFSTSYDFGETQNLGQSFVVTRIGSDIVFRLGLSWNPLRDNFGVGIEIQPRIAPNLHLGSLGGARVPIEYAPVE